MKKNTPRDFALQLGALISLYVSLTSLLVLLFGLINMWFPDEMTDYWMVESARDSMRVSIAMLVVFFPTFVILTRHSNQIRRSEDGGDYTTLTKWLIYLSLLVGGGIVLGDLVTIIMYFLNGEITTRFILKAITLLLVVGATLAYYVRDVQGYFKTRMKSAIYAGWVASAVVLMTVVLGCMYIETPQEVREMRFDDQQIDDLSDIAWRVEDYYRIHGELPETLADTYGELTIPTAPDERDEYSYTTVNATSFALCATFAHATDKDDHRRSYAPYGKTLAGIIPQARIALTMLSRKKTFLK